MLNFMIVIILEGHSAMCQQMAKKGNEYEIIEFIMESAKKLLSSASSNNLESESNQKYIEG